MATRSSVVVLGCLTVLAAGCSGGDGGDAAGAALATSPTTATSAAPSGLGSRPAELSLEGVDPCSLFSDEQLDQLKINSNPREYQGDDGPQCALDKDRAEPYYSYYVENVPDDLREWVDGDRAKNNLTTERTDVEGFPALTRHGESAEPLDCVTLVGTARGQTLRVQLAPISTGAFDQAQLCDMAKRAATFAMQTLQATR